HGLRGEEIHQIGRIVAVADVFDALTSDRPYRAGMPIEDAFAILRRVAGSELDPECVEALWRAREQGKILMQRERVETF
ncbi:MAG TPA: HD domain-containing phosphohydrolase, partial [Roseiflexaceae bacterium]|nr:HD domain-containing phosphohydrolase [Roseiflexaceae bacterium]